MGVTGGAGTASSSRAPTFTTVVGVARPYVFCYVLYTAVSLLVLFLYYMPFFDLRFLITPLLSSNSLYGQHIRKGATNLSQIFLLDWNVLS
jgi:phosphoglycerol transferase MdoB-like AlkP superfamily enzyme